MALFTGGLGTSIPRAVSSQRSMMTPVGIRWGGFYPLSPLRGICGYCAGWRESMGFSLPSIGVGLRPNCTGPVSPRGRDHPLKFFLEASSAKAQVEVRQFLDGSNFLDIAFSAYHNSRVIDGLKLTA